MDGKGQGIMSDDLLDHHSPTGLTSHCVCVYAISQTYQYNTV